MAQETCRCGAKSTSAVGPRDKMGRCRIWHRRRWSSRSCGYGSLPSSTTFSRCKRAGADERAAPSSRFGENGRHRSHLSSAGGARVHQRTGRSGNSKIPCRRRDPGAKRGQSATLVVRRRQGARSTRSDFARVQAAHARDPAGSAGVRSFRQLLSDPDFQIFYHAPALIVIAAVAASPWAVEDCSLAAENLMLATHAEGLGSCWIGFAQPWLNSPAGKAALGFPAAYIPVAPIIVGRPKAAPPPVPRKTPEIRWIA